MDPQFEILLKKIKIEMEKQSATLTETITSNLVEIIDSKLEPLIEENKKLREEIQNLKEKSIQDDNLKRKNNLLFFGIDESEQNTFEIINGITEIIKNLNVIIQPQDINNIYRLGKQAPGKIRPVMVNFVNTWKRNEVLKSKKYLPDNIYLKEDFSKEILEARKLLQPTLKAEREKGNIAYLKYDRIVIKDKNNTENRKRIASHSPNNTQNEPKDIAAPRKINKINAFIQMRSRSHSLSTNSNN